MKKTNVYFLHLKTHQYRGAVQMRCHQLAEIGAEYLSEWYEFHVRGLPGPKQEDQVPYVADIRDSLVILSKSAVAHLSESCFETLKQNNIAIAADWIDRGMKARFLDEIDLHIAASFSFLRYARAELPDARHALLTHHADLRISHLEFKPLAGLAPLYLGHLDNLPDWPELNAFLTVARAARGSLFADFLPKLPQFNLHYNVRPLERQQGTSFKPLTKGFTAAACHSNILMQRDVDDALDYLGDDYPYLLKDGYEITAIEGLTYAYESFGSAEWTYGLEIMASVAERTSPRFIAGELDGILAQLLDVRALLGPKRSQMAAAR